MAINWREICDNVVATKTLHNSKFGEKSVASFLPPTGGLFHDIGVKTCIDWTYPLIN